MVGRYLLDTNIVIAALSADEKVLGQISDADQCFVSATVLGEMLYGALSSAVPLTNLERVRSFIRSSGFLGCDDGTAMLYGEIKSSLRQKGKPIPDNDIWIADSTRQHSLTLVTRDAHFDEIDDLARERW
jgi:tRNA(fMet)-specific endonuclease VapC